MFSLLYSNVISIKIQRVTNEMRTKIHSILTALFAASAFTLSASANVATPSTTVDIPQQCQQLFSATDKLVAEAEKQPGTHTQVNKIKNKLNQSKKQILEMELATQIKSCDQGLVKLNSLKQSVSEQQDN